MTDNQEAKSQELPIRNWEPRSLEKPKALEREGKREAGDIDRRGAIRAPKTRELRPFLQRKE